MSKYNAADVARRAHQPETVLSWEQLSPAVQARWQAVADALSPYIGENRPPDSKWRRLVMERALRGKGLTPEELAGYFADPGHWQQITFNGYCHWSWCGPTIPPFETAQTTVNGLKEKP